MTTVNRPDITSPAMEVIKRADASLAHQMITDPDWDVHVFSMDDLDAAVRVMNQQCSGDPFCTRLSLDDFISAYGTTVNRRGGKRVPEQQRATNINIDDISDSAQEMGAPAEDFLAYVLVHEWAHHKYTDSELKAFQFSNVFARKLPASDAPIVTLGEMTQHYYE
jgi:hypothetical protein